MRANVLKPEPLTKHAFAPFGDVIDATGCLPKHINHGFAQRYDALAKIDVEHGLGTVNVSVFDAAPRPSPIVVRVMERHPLGSQLFAPMQDQPWIVLVCIDPQDTSSYRAFAATGAQGVNYARNIWHHPLLVLVPSRFLVVDRAGPGVNLEEVELDEARRLSLEA